MNWNTTKTGKLYHSFTNGHAVCNPRIRDTSYAEALDSAEKVHERVASLLNGTRICDKCEQSEIRAQLRRETAPAVTPRALVKPDVQAEVIEALAILRKFVRNSPFRGAEAEAINILDNAGVFTAIDEATGYDIDPAPERVSKCTCPELDDRDGSHLHGCPGDPAEWGDAAFVDDRTNHANNVGAPWGPTRVLGEDDMHDVARRIKARQNDCGFHFKNKRSAF